MIIGNQMKLKKTDAIRIITNACKNYDSFLDDRYFLIVYKEKDAIKYTEVGFRKSHFLHLTGVQTSLSAKRFYEKCLDGQLGEADFQIDNAGKVQQKLKVLPYLHDVLYNNCMIGDFLNSGIMIHADYFVGDTKFILSIGFRHRKSTDDPVTLYSGDIRKLTNPTNRVLAIFARTYPEKKYKETTYVEKGVNLSELNLPPQVILPKSDESGDDADKSTLPAGDDVH